jgi:hypothetical protein
MKAQRAPALRQRDAGLARPIGRSLWRGTEALHQDKTTVLIPVDARCNLFEHLPPLPSYRGLQQGEPVTLPPGRAKLATKPLPIGSTTFAKMAGSR